MYIYKIISRENDYFKNGGEVKSLKECTLALSIKLDQPYNTNFIK